MAQSESRSVRVKFTCSEGKPFTKSISSVNPALLESGGKEIARAAVDTLLEKQPFSKGIADCKGVDVVERSVTTVL